MLLVRDSMTREVVTVGPETTAAALNSARVFGDAAVPSGYVADKGTTYRKLILDKYPELDINFVHHAGNSSGINDGAAALVVSTERPRRAARRARSAEASRSGSQR